MKAIRVVILVFIVLVGAVLLGPRPTISGAYRSGQVGKDVSEWVASRATAYPDIIPGTEDRLIWADSSHKPTQLSVVYLHGFSGSPGMAFPFLDSLSTALHANTYITRLAGHGRTPEALGGATLAEWVQDTANALEVGSRIGERVVLIGLSTGGTLAAWAASQPEWAHGLAGLVLISPNIAPQDSKADMLLWPWGGTLARVAAGPTRHWEAYSEAHARYTTNDYPIGVLVQMMATVQLLREQDPASITAPVLVLYSHLDQVVSPETTLEFVGQLRTSVEVVDVGDVGDPSDHVIVGSALSPDYTMTAVAHVVQFLNQPSS